MQQFIRSQNVERYRRLLESVIEEPKRGIIVVLLAEERQKQDDAGDFVQYPAETAALVGMPNFRIAALSELF
jgi:hypothetical protein